MDEWRQIDLFETGADLAPDGPILEGRRGGNRVGRIRANVPGTDTTPTVSVGVGERREGNQ